MQRNQNSGWILKEKHRQVHSGFFKKHGEKSTRLKVRRLGSDSDSVTLSLGDCGQVTSPLWALVSVPVTWKIETEDLKALSPFLSSENGGALRSLSTRLAFLSGGSCSTHLLLQEGLLHASPNPALHSKPGSTHPLTGGGPWSVAAHRNFTLFRTLGYLLFHMEGAQ